MKTYSLKSSEVNPEWYIIDAKDQTLGRLATQIANLLNGKGKPSYTPHVVSGDIVVVINAKLVKVTGQKFTDKIYYRHTGYPGGIREINFKDQMQKDPTKIIEHAVAGMLGKNKLQAKKLQNLKVYAGAEHNHEAQKPTLIEVNK